jgi:hypothetical protein
MENSEVLRAVLDNPFQALLQITGAEKLSLPQAVRRANLVLDESGYSPVTVRIVRLGGSTVRIVRPATRLDTLPADVVTALRDQMPEGALTDGTLASAERTSMRKLYSRERLDILRDVGNCIASPSPDVGERLAQDAMDLLADVHGTSGKGGLLAQHVAAEEAFGEILRITEAMAFGGGNPVSVGVKLRGVVDRYRLVAS